MPGLPQPDSSKRPHFVVALFGSLEYDGRARRMMELLCDIGTVTIVDIRFQSTVPATATPQVSRVVVPVPEGRGKIIKHLRLWTAAIRTAWRHKPSAFVAEDFFTALPAWVVATFLRTPVIYDAHELIIPELGRSMSWRDRFWYLTEKIAVQKARLIIAANPERAMLMARHYHLGGSLEYMRNIPIFRPTPVDNGAIIRKYPTLARRDSADRIILYQGDVALARGLGRFLEAVERLPENYRLVIAGEGRDRSALAALGEALIKQGRLAFLGRVPHELLPAVSASACVGIVTYPYTGLNNIYCAPNKLFEYAQAGVPVVSTDQPPLTALLDRYNIGILVRRRDGADAIAVALRKVADQRERYVDELASFVAAHTWEKESARVSQRICEILGGPVER